MSSKSKYSNKILKKLGEKPAIPLEFFKDVDNSKTSYAITRSIKNLIDSGCAEMLNSANQKFLRITKEGRKKMHSLELENDTTLVNTTWDGYWRIILLDLPESRKAERESLRYLLKKAGFVCLKNSAWISPLPFEHLFKNIKKDLGLTTEIMIFLTDNIDEEYRKVLFENFRS